MSGCMRKRIKEEKWRKAGGVTGSWDIQWSRKHRGMTRGAVAVSSRKENVKEVEQSSEMMETHDGLQAHEGMGSAESMSSCRLGGSGAPVN